MNDDRDFQELDKSMNRGCVIFGLIIFVIVSILIYALH